MNAHAIRKHFLSFHRQLFLSVISLFIVFALCFLFYQYEREKSYKVELLNTRLQILNDRLYEAAGRDSFSTVSFSNYLKDFPAGEVLVTVINKEGIVLYDNMHSDTEQLENHLEREEIRSALQEGTGHHVRRTSETTGVPYFYSARVYDHYIIRTALPYDVSLIHSLKAESGFIWFTITVTLILIFVFYTFTSRLGASITRLREFTLSADNNQPVDPEIAEEFPHNELGEISQHIVRIYNRLNDTKNALYMEREKLFTHLQSSHEGLGVFTKDKKEILVNSLFTQYSNLISDHNLKNAEEVFAISEFVSITEFITKEQKRFWGKREDQTSVTISKNGRIFLIECIIFEDQSFEISINDITQQEEQNRLKRQLTQNIAHELKTPVSSIQGYLETIVSNPGIDPEKIRTFLERCYAQSNRLSRLLRDISVLTRMDEASEMIEMEPVSINSLLTTILNEVALELEERQITVINSLKKEIKIKGNYSLLYSIFRNLTDNSIAYAGEGITIRINCFREDQKFFYFSFSDTGVGVDPEHLNRLFERFYRVDKGRSRKIGGTGLGLAIVKNAVLMHGGTISAKNHRDQGLEFVFTLAKDEK
ncbi:MAG: ATP-binding protein [Bacteroides sp.]|nr:ATP-binding protein [Bacteroides sp.]